jgi:hypothetical protein
MEHKMPRGAKPSPRHKLAAAKPHVIVGTSPANILYHPSTLSMWGNYDHGDCVTAEEAFAKACYSPEIFIPEQVAIDWATAHGVLEGAVISDVLEWMMTAGFQTGGATYTDGGHSSVDWTNPAILQNAIATGPVKLGIGGNQLDTAWHAKFWNVGKKNGWFITGFTPEADEDHCVTLCGYGTISWLAQQFGVTVPAGINGNNIGYALFTWDSIAIIDQPSMLAITHEAWVRNPTTFIMHSGAVQTSANTYYFEFKGNGVHAYNIAIPGIHSNSTVMAAISEFSTNSRVDRFMGAAKMRAYNISPYNGGVVIWTEVTWTAPLNVVLDILVY